MNKNNEEEGVKKTFIFHPTTIALMQIIKSRTGHRTDKALIESLILKTARKYVK